MKITRRNFLLLSGLTSFSLFRKKQGSRKSMDTTLKKPPIKAERDAWIELNLKNMGWNLDILRKRTKVPIMAVIKSNAYGHGLIEVGQYLDEKGIDSLMVCKLQEGVTLREVNVSCPIHNFGPYSPKDSEALIHYDISQSVFTEEAKSLNQTALKLGKKAKIHIHVDTGMGRMGVFYYKALPFIKKASQWKGIQIEGISTTLTEVEFYSEQLSRFLSLCNKAKKKGISLGRRHAASTAGVFSSSSAYLDMVRPGIAFYGFCPSKEEDFSLKPVLQFKSRVAAVKTLRPGETLGYQRDFTEEKRTKYAVIPVGSTDGYPYTAAKKASVLIKGQRFPLISAISFNHMEALLKPDSEVAPGDEVVFIGTQGKEAINVDELAEWAGTSTYKILAFLSPLLPKKII